MVELPDAPISIEKILSEMSCYHKQGAADPSTSQSQIVETSVHSSPLGHAYPGKAYQEMIEEEYNRLQLGITTNKVVPQMYSRLNFHQSEEKGALCVNELATSQWRLYTQQNETLQAENSALRLEVERLKSRMSLKSAVSSKDAEKPSEEIECARERLQHQVNYLKGAVEAKEAELQAFQLYASNARNHIQAQSVLIQRGQVHRRRFCKIAMDSVHRLHKVRQCLLSIRIPMKSLEGQFITFINDLQRPMLALVSRSESLKSTASATSESLNKVLLKKELARRHLHNEIWISRENCLIICRILKNDSAKVKPHQISMHNMSSTLGAETNAHDDTGSDHALYLDHSSQELRVHQTRNTAPMVIKLDQIVQPDQKANGESVIPFAQSILDGVNGLVVTFDNYSRKVQEQIDLALLETLYRLAAENSSSQLQLCISYSAVYKEQIFDLLALNPKQFGEKPENGLLRQTLTALRIKNIHEASIVLQKGLERLTEYETANTTIQSLTHQVISISVSYDNFILADLNTKSMLQIVKLAVGSDNFSAHIGLNSSAIPKDISALLQMIRDCRADTLPIVQFQRLALTILLRDTIRLDAKCLCIFSIHESCSNSTGAIDPSIIRACTVMQSLRNLHHDPSDDSTSPSVEAFANRFQSKFPAPSINAHLSRPLLRFSAQSQPKRIVMKELKDCQVGTQSTTKQLNSKALRSVLSSDRKVSLHRGPKDARQEENRVNEKEGKLSSGKASRKCHKARLSSDKSDFGKVSTQSFQSILKCHPPFLKSTSPVPHIVQNESAQRYAPKEVYPIQYRPFSKGNNLAMRLKKAPFR